LSRPAKVAAAKAAKEVNMNARERRLRITLL
jgi:hypothetical protein